MTKHSVALIRTAIRAIATIVIQTVDEMDKIERTRFHAPKWPGCSAPVLDGANRG